MAIDPAGNTVILKFGGGLNSQDISTDIDPRECSAGQNFDMPTSNLFLRPRRSVDQVASAPNSLSIRGFAQLIKADDTRSFLVQAGSNVYEWDGASGSGGMTLVGTINSSAQMRGYIEGNSVKDNKVYIGDLNLADVIHEWDGTTFQPLVTDLGGTFKGRYATVFNERLFVGNVDDDGTLLPQMVAASQQDDFGQFTNQRPASGLASTDPFFLATPNLAPVKGLIPAFRKLAIATSASDWYSLEGTDAKDHTLDTLYTGGSVKGDEAVAFTGNDIVFGKQGAIDSLSATQRFGDLQADDLTRWIAGDVMGVTSWTIQYSPRFDRLYCIPSGGGKVYVLSRAFLDTRIRAALFGSETVDISPWSKWVTANSFNFEPTASMRAINPSDGLEYIYLGDASGNIWQLESDTGDDNGSVITMNRTSIPFSVPAARVYDVQGWVKARKVFAGDITISALFGGRELHDQSTTVTIDASDNAAVWSGTGSNASYWSGTEYWNVAFNGRLARKDWTVPGDGDQVQIKVEILSSDIADYDIEEIGIQLNPEESEA